jgi:transposase
VIEPTDFRSVVVQLLTYGAVSPEDGKADFLILPYITQKCFQIFLNEISRRYKDDYIMMVCDGAACHRNKSIEMPINIELVSLPPYSPELNPQENIWDDMREKWFKNKAFASIDAVVDQLEKACLFYEKSSEICKSIRSFSWITCSLKI